MKIIFEPSETEEYFYNALCNSGVSCLAQYGLVLYVPDSQYTKVANKLKKENNDIFVCIEDVYMQVLREYGLKIIDTENDGEYTRRITLNDVHNRMSLVPMHHVVDIIDGNDDANTADAILQTIFFGEIIFS